MYTRNEKIIPVYIEDEMKDSYINYAMSVIVGRALPDARDGLKPVHRRILYGMLELGLQHTKPYKKSARIVGECFVKDTLVLTERGLTPVQSIRIGDMVYTQRGLCRVTELYEMPPQNLLEVTLENGLSNIVTPSQKFKILTENLDFAWKEAKDLTADDHIVTRTRYPDLRECQKLSIPFEDRLYLFDKDLAYLLGFFVSDGWIAQDKKRNLPRVCFFSTHKEVIEAIACILIGTFDYVPTIEEKCPRGATKAGESFKKGYTIRINRQHINEFLIKNFCLEDAAAPTKRLPAQLFCSPKEVIFSFISGLIDGDGSIHKNRTVIHYGSVSEKLIDQLMLLLLHLGIFSTKYTDNTYRSSLVNGKKVQQRHLFHYLETRSVDAIKLAMNMRLFNSDKLKKCRAIVGIKLKKSKYETVPYGGHKIFGELSTRHIGSGWYKDSQGNKFRMGIKYPTGCKIRYSSDLRQKALRKSQLVEWGIKEKLDKVDSPSADFINRIIDDDIYFLKVSSVKKAEREKTYDIQVDGEHEFIANGMIAHNCLGKFHPHGDIAVYDALVRMAQDFSLRYPLIDGQGNFGCFTGDTKVLLCDGTALSFKELIAEQKQGKKHWTFSFNPTANKIEITEIKKPRLTRRKEKILEVILDNGEKIRCTLDHLFMVRNGRYKKAKDLRAGDSLMPLNLKFYDGQEDVNLKGYRMAYQPKQHVWEFVHHLADETERENRGVPKIENALNYFKDFEELLTAAERYNHKVAGIKILREKEDVYDLTVEPWHNFSLAAGVFVHNSIDGDPAAAMRYSEARLARVADWMLTDLDKETVDFVPNFDGSLTEPAVLPSALPNLLVNGSSGIAVGMATNIPPHNLNEVVDGVVALIDDPEIDIKGLSKKIKGPDFPTGGIISGFGGIQQAYRTGRGLLKVHAKACIEEQKGGKECIIITEIPYQVNKTTLLESIASLVQDKKIEGIADLRDESDREGMRIVVELKRGANGQIVLNQLYKHTQMQETFGVIMLALVEGRPHVLNLKQVLQIYIDHRREIVIRRTKYDLAKAQERAHILEGLKIAVSNIDRIVKIIRQSKDPAVAKEELMKKFKLSDRQAQAILEMQLQRLTNLERKKLDEEYLELIKKIELYQSILASERKVLEVIKDELKALKEQFGDTRRTEILPETKELEIEDLIAEEDMVITISHAGYIKRLPVSAYKRQRRGGKGVTGAATKEEDFIEDLFIASTHDYILFFTNKGKVYWLKVHEIPQASRQSKGKAIINMIQLETTEKITAFVPAKEFSPDKFLVMATRRGNIKKTRMDAFANPRRAGIIAITLDKDDELIDARATGGNEEIVLATKSGKAIRFPETQVRDMGRTAGGVRGVSLEKSDEVINMEIAAKDATLLTVTEAGFGKRTPIKEYRKQSRGGKGITNIKITKEKGHAVGVKSVTDQDELMLITQSGMIVRCPIKEVRASGRATQGVRLIRLEKNDHVASIARLIPEEEDEAEAGEAAAAAPERTRDIANKP